MGYCIRSLHLQRPESCLTRLYRRDPFKAGTSLPAPKIHEYAWCTTIASFGKSSERENFVPVSTIRRFLKTNTSFLKFPKYLTKHISFLDVHGYEAFSKDLDHANSSQGLIIGRSLTEAAWCKVVINAYKSMDKELKLREGEEFERNLKCLSSCLAQVRSGHVVPTEGSSVDDAQRRDLAFKHCLDKSIKHPGLDLAVSSFKSRTSLVADLA